MSSFQWSYAGLWVVALAFFARDIPFSQLQVGGPVWQAVLSGPWITWQSCCVVLGYIVAMAVLGELLPGVVIAGRPLKDGSRLTYKCNGLLLLFIYVVGFAGLAYTGRIPGSYIADHYKELLVTTNIFSVLFGVYLLVLGRLRRPKNWFHSPTIAEDFWNGTELNPFVLGVDVKFFAYRPGMLGWLAVNLSYACRQIDVHGTLTTRMLLYQAMTGWYVVDYFVHETRMTTTFDIVAEHYGFMLIWGMYVWAVFFFSVQNLYLWNDLRPIGSIEAIAILGVFAVGFAIFRGCNNQKHSFKTFPDRSIWGHQPKTVRGKLLVSGFWGLARHVNYLGDLILAVSYSLPCGLRYSTPWFYFTYLLLLLLHRDRRDEERCADKYGEIWTEYCTKVPWRILPGVY